MRTSAFGSPVERERQPAEEPEPFDVEHVAVLGYAETGGHRGGGRDRADGADLVGDPALFTQGLGEAFQPVEAVPVLVADDDRAEPRHPFHQLLGAEQVEGLADGVAGGAVVTADGALVGQRAVGEGPGEDLVAQQVGELPGLVGTQPATPGGDGGRSLSGVVSDAFGGHASDHTDACPPLVLRQCCATPVLRESGSELRLRGCAGKICHRSPHGHGGPGADRPAALRGPSVVPSRRTHSSP